MEDKLLREALDFIRGQKYVGIIMLQRHFRCGIMRAFRLIEELQENGAIGLEGTEHGYLVKDSE
jgi:DNA segregation ATPase FtsK/SpoIIIE-like protein